MRRHRWSARRVGRSARRSIPLLTGITIVTTTVVLSSCATDETPDALDPHGQEASHTFVLWWLLLGAAAVVTLVVAGLIVWGALRAPRRNPGGLGDDAFIGVGGIAIPGVILIAVGVLTVVFTASVRPADGGADVVHVEVIGHDWWWEVRYRDLGIVTANEIHLPVDRDVDVELRSADVIHSFWVPQLAGKQDLVPGQVNHLAVRADDVGTYTGVCAEFCGEQHAGMGFLVAVDSADDFTAWTADQQTVEPELGALARRGQEVWDAQPCAGCHTLQGAGSVGTAGPDLTELGDRQTLGAGVLDNTDADLAHWITSVQDVKPGALMLGYDLSPDDLDALVAFLESNR